MPASVIGLQHPCSPITARFIAKGANPVLLFTFPNELVTLSREFLQSLWQIMSALAVQVVHPIGVRPSIEFPFFPHRLWLKSAYSGSSLRAAFPHVSRESSSPPAKARPLTRRLSGRPSTAWQRMSCVQKKLETRNCLPPPGRGTASCLCPAAHPFAAGIRLSPSSVGARRSPVARG